jgi:hypothetical protein
MSNRLIALILRLHWALLRLYPHPYQDEFGEDLQALFAAMLQEAAHTNAWAAASVVGRELFELPINVVDEHLGRLRRSGYLMNHICAFGNGLKDFMRLVGPILWGILWKGCVVAAIASLLVFWIGWTQHISLTTWVGQRLYEDFFFTTALLILLAAGFSVGGVRQRPAFMSTKADMGISIMLQRIDTEITLENQAHTRYMGIASTLHRYRLTLLLAWAGIIALLISQFFYEVLSAMLY